MQRLQPSLDGPAETRPPAGPVVPYQHPSLDRSCSSRHQAPSSALLCGLLRMRQMKHHHWRHAMESVDPTQTHTHKHT